GKWLVDLGEVPDAALKDVPAEFAKDEIEAWSTTSQTPSGPLRHLRPVVQMSETPAHWARPSVPLGYHQPVWPPRGAGRAYAGSFSRIAHIFLKAGRDWQAASQRFTLGAASNSADADCA